MTAVQRSLGFNLMAGTNELQNEIWYIDRTRTYLCITCKILFTNQQVSEITWEVECN
jgi:hypothetical protein